MLPRQSCRLGRACITQVLLFLFGLELPRRGSARRGGIRDARIKVHPFNFGGPAEEVREEVEFVKPEPRPIHLIAEAQDPETQQQFVHSGRDFCTAFHWESPTKESFAHGLW